MDHTYYSHTVYTPASWLTHIAVIQYTYHSHTYVLHLQSLHLRMHGTKLEWTGNSLKNCLLYIKKTARPPPFILIWRGAGVRMKTI